MNIYIRGFTLIELMIVVTIIGILSSIAVPSYLSYMQDGRRSEAQHTLLSNSMILERQYTRLGGYPDTYQLTSNDYYNFSYAVSASAVASSATNDATAFTLTASPKSGGAQASDECGTLSINHQGITTATSADCWK